jgi:hypothetical protein
VLHKPSPLFNRLLDRINAMPVVDSHEHLRGPDRDPEATPTEPISAAHLGLDDVVFHQRPVGRRSH